LTHPVFGYLLSNLISNLIDTFDNKEIIKISEFGAGNGTLAYDIKKSLASFGYKNFSYEAFDRSITDSVEKVERFDPKKIKKANRIIISNELFDALPHHIFEIKNKKIFEKYVEFKNNKLIEVLDEPSSNCSCIINRINRLSKPIDNCVGEVFCSKNSIFQSFKSSCDRAYIISIDYGLNEKDLFYKGKKKSNLSVIHNHSFYDNYFYKPGYSDITFQVDINELLNNFENINFKINYLGNQREFLFNLGIGEILGKLSSLSTANEEINYNRYAINQLIKPNGMGNYFVTIHSNFNSNFNFLDIKYNNKFLEKIPLIEEYPQRFELPGVYKKNTIIKEDWI